MPEPTFADCLSVAARTPEFVTEFDRLAGTNLSFRGSVIERMIDDATGRTEPELIMFIEFVYEFVYRRLKPDNL